ncbi:MAG: lipase maturation factor family protein [Myxococcales bacterium]|nr:lipase maturation factor family protein [Myxococcales bacterium]
MHARLHGADGNPLWGHRPELHSGPLVARAFQRALAAVLLVAWLSLGSQLQLLIGSRGLLPAGRRFEALAASDATFWDAPSALWWWNSDAALTAHAVLGVLLALLALVGLWPRLCFALSAPLYLSIVHGCGVFTAFQWDNMLVEVLVLAAFLPGERVAPVVHFILRLLLFKLYFQSGIAKWQSYLGDWHDGSAMTFYYETAPIPARLAWHAHHLPEAWHHLESWGALVLELLVPLLIFGPRWARLLAFASFTGFQTLNTSTANYGFFTYLSTVLHLFLLRDTDIARVFRLALPGRDALRPRVFTRPALTLLATALCVGWIGLSTAGALARFSGDREVRRLLAPLQDLHAPLRIANVYHLFGHITRDRLEPQFEALIAGGWRELDLHFKPGAPERPPPYVAPHQPRVDFRLWFYGLSHRRGMPRYVNAILDRLCRDPEAVAPLFANPLPRAPDAVRIALYRYHFTSPEQRADRGAYWTRSRLGALPHRSCR